MNTIQASVTKAQTQSYYQRWLGRRIPPNKKQQLYRKNIFILPSKAGLGFLITVVLLWILGTNYQNNLAIVMAFLLLSLMHTCMFYTYAALSGLSVEVLLVEPCFLGDYAKVHCRLSSRSGRKHHQIKIAWKHSAETIVDVNTGESFTLILPLLPKQRGWFHAERLRISSTYPLGLLRAWSTLDMDVDVLVYPKPIASDLPDARLQVGDSPEDVIASTAPQTIEVTEDISHLREYRVGDPRKKIAWKSYAKGQGLATKEYEALHNVAREQWLTWDDFSGFPTEERLSRLCDCVLQAEQQGLLYGLQLPNQTLAMGSGMDHRQQLLRALALFECPHVKREAL